MGGEMAEGAPASSLCSQRNGSMPPNQTKAETAGRTLIERADEPRIGSNREVLNTGGRHYDH